jgi:hypothetical protein
MGLIGGTGGGACSTPFLNDAAAERLMVSMTEVVERKIGSEMSALATDFFRSGPPDGMAAPDVAWKE